MDNFKVNKVLRLAMSLRGRIGEGDFIGFHLYVITYAIFYYIK